MPKNYCCFNHQIKKITCYIADFNIQSKTNEKNFGSLQVFLIIF